MSTSMARLLHQVLVKKLERSYKTNVFVREGVDLALRSVTVEDALVMVIDLLAFEHARLVKLADEALAECVSPHYVTTTAPVHTGGPSRDRAAHEGRLVWRIEGGGFTTERSKRAYSDAAGWIVKSKDDGTFEILIVDVRPTR